MDGYNHNYIPSSSDGGHRHHQNMNNSYSTMNGWNVTVPRPDAAGNFAHPEHGDVNGYSHSPNTSNNIVASHHLQVPFYVQQELQQQLHHQPMTSPSSMSNYSSNFANCLHQGLVDSQQQHQQQHQQQQNAPVWYQAPTQGIHYQTQIPPPPPPRPPPPPPGPPPVPLLLDQVPQQQISSLPTGPTLAPSSAQYRYDQIFMGNAALPEDPSFPSPHHQQYLQNQPLFQPQQQLQAVPAQQVAPSASIGPVPFPPQPPLAQLNPLLTTAAVSLVPQQARKTNINNKKKNRRKPKKNPKKVKRRRELEVLQEEQNHSQEHDAQQQHNDPDAVDGDATTATEQDFPKSPGRKKMRVRTKDEEDLVVHVSTATDASNTVEMPKEIALRTSDPMHVSSNDDNVMVVSIAPVEGEIAASKTSSDEYAVPMDGGEAAATDGVPAQDGGNNTPRTNSRKILELVRAKLERARLKKMDMEDRMRKEQAEREAMVENHTNVVGVSTSNNEKKLDAKAALERARSKLRGALKNRRRALGTSVTSAGAASSSASTSTRHWLPPVSGLSASMVITDIANTGPAELVYFPHPSLDTDLGRARLIAMLGEKVMAELHSDKMPDATEYPGGVDASDGKPPSTSLADRKRQLQQELMALKEKLEKTQQTAGNSELLHSLGGNHEARDDLLNGISGPEDGFTSTSALDDGGRKTLKRNANQVATTKEELERRKVEAQNFMDISYWKHFVSKQEHLLSQVSDQVEETTRASEKCRGEEIEIDMELHSVEDSIALLETRKKVIDDGIAQSMTHLLECRQELHQALTAARNAEASASKLRL